MLSAGRPLKSLAHLCTYVVNFAQKSEENVVFWVGGCGPIR